ncbi:phosphomannomutase [Actinacidiphila yanglinensis]|uniref:Phosphomannomutase n=1 Tax=Actinacidiphila yanglinensis TaxID=310779 RepID=A0A1H6BLI5_9ACTN|nr:phospho-sugar mutase [Actinacidiphila yanglinensis]SEG61502.1 phosphomannomutase [Actinacidiphila yanglinensis]
MRLEPTQWIAEDPDPETRAELQALVDAAKDGNDSARADLEDRFRGTLEFGTAGLRGAMGGGPMRMNRAVVIRAAAGLAAYLENIGGGLVVIGYDARHRSERFARDTAAVMVGAGLRAAVLPRPLPTPVLAFAIRHLGAAAGVMVTASHNPPQDNGYKVYLGDGSQIVPPADAEIAARIAAVGPLETVPRPEDGWTVLGEEIVTAYLDRAVGVVAPGGPREVATVYTPMHGVGLRTLLAAFERAGFPAPAVVPRQAEPDPDFPTVAFPNPEEPGAMDLAFATAREHHPDVVIANDPDADRCAAAVPDPAAPGGVRMLRGDELGALLAVHLVRRGAAVPGRDTFAASIVSSSLLSKIAAGAGLGYADTLTGFKWISRVKGLRYGYEEALGYCVDPAGVRDKDGITAALLVAELAATLKRESRTLADLLDELALTHGLHATDQLSARVADLSLIGAAMKRLRADPPAALAGLAVTGVDDLAEGAGGLPPTDGLRYHLAGAPVDGARVVVRPSGTEPKIKCYLEVVVPVSDGSALTAARSTAADLLAALKADLAAAAGI